MPLLNPGDPFPRLTLNIPGARAVQVPGALAGEFAVMLFNRGAWCPYCTAQLRAFQRARESLAQAGIRVAALWVDGEETTAQFAAKHGLTFPLGHSADARAVAALTGAFVNPDPGLPAVHRLRAGSAGQGERERVLKRRHRPPDAR